ncbi:TPA: hypothetical protein QDB28_004022 [Burkholderia vietnamiensis]|nr:hypothetical protein [Burkholderia vietnamiensis]
MINPALLQGLASGRVITGDMAMGDAEALQKALTAGYGTDVSTLTGGAALRIQSLDKTMKTVIQENKHFVLFNELAKSNATATVDEWTEQHGVGGFLGGSTNTELGNINQATGDYARRVGMVKFLMTQRQVSFVQSITNNIVEAEAVEAQNGALQLLTDAEYLSFEGDSTIVATEFDGIGAQINSLNSADHVVDAAGGQVNKIDLIDQAAATISGFGNFGTPTHFFSSQLVQSDLNTSLDPAFRVSLTNVGSGGIELGAPVVGMRTSWGEIKNCPDVFIRDEKQLTPFELRYPAFAVANAALQPAGVAVAVNAAGGASSKWTAGQAGNYYYAVTGLNANGESQAVVTAQAAVTAGGNAVLTITRSAGGQETGYAIYRGRLNGTSQLSDLRLMKRIPASGGATTVFTDLNQDIPGTTKAYILNMRSGADAINWRQLLPMTKFALYPTNAAVIPWAQLLFGYLRIAKRQQHVMIKNIVPSGAAWRPFN